MEYSGTKEIEIELRFSPKDGVWLDDRDEELPEALADFVESCHILHDFDPKIEIEMTYSGYHEEAYISGPPEDCYPEEGEEERDYSLPEVVTNEDGTDRYEIPREIVQLDEVARYFDWFIDNADIS